MFEEIVYVVSGRGASMIWNSDGPKRTFEWHRGSLFAVPLNAWHQLFNGQGDQPVRLFVVSTAPIVMNLYRDIDFVFNNTYSFMSRFDGREDFFNGQGTSLDGRIWQTNFLEDVRTFPLIQWKERGAGGFNRNFHLAGSASWAHISEFPVGTYKKAHRHGPGAHVVIISGEGYSLLWQEGKEKIQVPWKEGSLIVPPNMWFHQHFNTGPAPARYLAIHKARLSASDSRVDVSLKEGGNQIEYEDEDPSVGELFRKELANRGVENRMPSRRLEKR
jgi:oxalate decarboxylase/phosphoglucose isomerase-like protein (cupin superfamily)